MTPQALELTINPKPGGRVRVVMVERLSGVVGDVDAGAAGGARTGTLDMPLARWTKFYRPMLQRACASASIRLVVIDRPAPARARCLRQPTRTP